MSAKRLARWYSWVSAPAARRGGEINSEEGKIARAVRVGQRLLLAAEAEEAVLSRNDRGSEELVPVRGRDGERGNDEGPAAVLPGFSNETVQQGRRRVDEESFAVQLSAARAKGSVPVANGEGVFGLSVRLGEASEEAWKEGVGG